MKKICLLLCFVMLIGCCPVLAESGTVISIADGPGYADTTNHSAMVVAPEITVVSGDTPADYKYQWYFKPDNTTEWMPLPWEIGASLTISTQEARGWIAVDVTPLDAYGNAIGDTVNKSLVHTWALHGMNGVSGFTKDVGMLYQETPKEYLFEVDGVKLILLDALWDGTYYVMMEDGVQKMAFDPDGTVIFDPADENNIAYWLNNDFLSGDYLPSSVKEYMAKNVKWTTEHPYNGTADGSGNTYWNEYQKTATVGLLSSSEFAKYLGRFGLWLSNYQSKKAVIESGWTLPWDGDSGFWLRTSKGDTNNQLLSSQQWGWVYNDAGAGSGDIDIVGAVSGTNATVTTRWARPTFRLTRDFFANVKLSPDAMGDKVKQVLMEDCTIDELRALYTEEELSKIDSSLAYPYLVKNMIVRDGDDGSVKVSFDLIRYGERVNSEHAFICAYEGGRLVKVKAFPLEQEKGESRYITADMGVIEGYDDIRVICLDTSILQPGSRLMTLEDAQRYASSGGDIADYCEILLPDTLYGVAATEMNLYFENAVYCNNLANYQVDVVCDKGIQQAERWTYTPTAAESFSLTLRVYQNFNDMVASKSVSVKVLAKEEHSVLLDAASELLGSAVAERMTVTDSAPDTVVAVVGEDESIEELTARIGKLQSEHAGVPIGILPPIPPASVPQLRIAKIENGLQIKDIMELVSSDSNLFLIPAGWNVDSVYSCDVFGINEAGAQQAADIILAAVCDKGGNAE